MISANLATWITIGVAVFLMIVIPILDGSKRFGKYISLRYTLVVVILSMMLGCILDFSHLSETSRNIVLYGGIIIAGLFVVVRSLEKCKLGSRTVRMTAKKGDAELSAEIESENKNKTE